MADPVQPTQATPVSAPAALPPARPPTYAKAPDPMAMRNRLRGVAMRLKKPRNYARAPTAKHFLSGSHPEKIPDGQ